MLRSTDGGQTWSPPYPTIVNSPHGPTQLADGRLLYAGKELWTAQKRVGVCHSSDDGQTWKWLWYETQAGSLRAVLRQARWRLPG